MNCVPTLLETQQRLLGALRGRADSAQTDAALSLLKWAGGPGTTHRLQIYRNNLFESLAGALGAVFPVLSKLVGEDYFRQMVRLFIARHPLQAGDLHGFGKELPMFLRELPSAADLRYLADVADLEWAWHEVYHEAQSAPLDPACLSEVPAEQQMNLGLQLTPAARLVTSPFPVLRIWQAHQHDLAADFELSLDEGGVRVLVLRRTLDIEFVPLAGAEAYWLSRLSSGVTLAEATLEALQLDPTFDLASILGRHLALGSFTAMTFAALPLAFPEEETA